MLVSSLISLGTILTFLALVLLFITQRHAAGNPLGQTEMDYAYGTSDQTVIGGPVTEPPETVVYDKLSRDTPSDIEANWSATIGAKSLLQKVREFRVSTQASYNDDSKKSVRKALEDAELELESLGKESFDTKRIVRGVQKLKVALEAAEEVIARGPDPKTTISKPTIRDSVTNQLENGLRDAKEDRRTRTKAASLKRLRKSGNDADTTVAQSKEHPDFH